MSDEPRTYRFGTLERNGFLGGLRPAQLVHLGLCTFLSFLGFLALGTAHPGIAICLALGLAVIGIIGAFMPIAGQPVADWVPVAARYLARGSRRSWRSASPVAGVMSKRLRVVPDQALQLGVVEQQLAGAVRLRHDVRGGRAQRCQVGAEQEGLAVAQVHVGLGELGAAGAHGLHFPALQRDARLVALLDEIVVARLAVLGDQAGRGGGFGHGLRLMGQWVHARG